MSYHFKIIIVGDSSVGKSNIISKFVENEFNTDPMSTIGVDVRFKIVTVDNFQVKLQIWDTSGQERFRSILPAYYRGSDLAIFVYSVDNPNSLTNVPVWINDLQNHVPHDTLKYVVGNKCDLRRKVSYDDGVTMANLYSASFGEISAKDGTNIDNLFKDVAAMLVTKFKDHTYKIHDLLPVEIVTTPKTNCCI